MAQVRLEGISRKYGSTIVLEDISFEVAEGQFCVLLGPSGCGKSTILRLIAGLDQPTTGEIYIGDTLVNSIPGRERDVAMVFQNYALYPHMSVAENLSFGLRMRKVAKGMIKQKVETIAQALDIDHLLNRKPKQLSGGQQQRVALGRAIIRQPKVFLLDEPLSNLDTQLREALRIELKQLHSNFGITTIYVTHDQVEALTLAEQIIVFNQGKIQQIGTPHSLYNQPANQMVATFLGSPPMNIFPVTYSQGAVKLGEQVLSLSPSLDLLLSASSNSYFQLGIRPEHLTLVACDSPDSWKVKIDELESLGRETLVRGHLVDSHLPLNFFTPSMWSSKKGEVVFLEPSLKEIFFFENGRLIEK